MYHSAKLQPAALAGNLLVTLGVGALSGFLVRDATDLYATLERPVCAPPAAVFPLVWTVLYLLMGISAYLIFTAQSPLRTKALGIYAAQLLVNAAWAPVFFLAQNYGAALLLVVALWFLVLWMFLTFRQISLLAARLQIPYLLWVTYACYLTLGIYLRNPL